MSYVMCTKTLPGTKLTLYKVYHIFWETKDNYILPNGIDPQSKKLFSKVSEVKSLQKPVIGDTIIVLQNGRAFLTSQIQSVELIDPRKYVIYTVNSVYVVNYIG